MTLPKAKPVPLYEQVKQDILARIASGEWQSGSRLPSEHEWVERLGISRMTVHRALRELSDKGVIDRQQGIGTFVATPPQRSELVAIKDIAEEITQRGNTHRAEVVVLDAIRANIDLATAFEHSVGVRIFHSVIVHYEDDTPIQLEERFVNPVFAPDYLSQDFTAVTPSHYLHELGAATEVEQIIYAGQPDERAQRLLHIEPGEACLLLLRRTWAGTTPATKNFFTYPGSRYSLGSRYKVPAIA